MSKETTKETTAAAEIFAARPGRYAFTCLDRHEGTNCVYRAAGEWQSESLADAAMSMRNPPAVYAGWRQCGRAAEQWTWIEFFELGGPNGPGERAVKIGMTRETWERVLREDMFALVGDV
jgi:hypothetical protein